MAAGLDSWWEFGEQDFVAGKVAAFDSRRWILGHLSGAGLCCAGKGDTGRRVWSWE